jgi:anti-sigma regulatory factor (Ser/Thr protein kinase)
MDSAIAQQPDAMEHRRFRHEAFLYGGAEEFLDGALRFIEDGLRAGEPTMAMVAPARITALREALGTDAERVCFADMRRVGANPARIIPAWAEFLATSPPGRRRGIGEPIWPGRAPAELTEAQHHELLLNLALERSDGLWVLCPYDVSQLSPDVIAAAHHSHPVVSNGHPTQLSADVRSEVATAVLSGALPSPPGAVDSLTFDVDRLHQVRGFVARRADAILDARRAADFVLAVDEVATNSLRYGGGSGVLRLWDDERVLVCDVRDRGYLTDPMVGRVRPAREQIGGRGLWIANQLCDLVQIRSGSAGTTVRLHMQYR